MANENKEYPTSMSLNQIREDLLKRLDAGESPEMIKEIEDSEIKRTNAMWDLAGLQQPDCFGDYVRPKDAREKADVSPDAVILACVSCSFFQRCFRKTEELIGEFFDQERLLGTPNYDYK